MRMLERNKNKTLQIANRTGEVIRDDNGKLIDIYGAIEKIELCLLPMENEREAESYGVSFVGGLKSILSISDGVKFDEFTHIWIDKLKDFNSKNTEYVVKGLRKFLTHSILVIEKKAGE